MPYDQAPCTAAGYLTPTYAYPNKSNWCKLTLDTDADECPAKRFAMCDPFTGY